MLLFSYPKNVKQEGCSSTFMKFSGKIQFMNIPSQVYVSVFQHKIFPTPMCMKNFSVSQNIFSANTKETTMFAHFWWNFHYINITHKIVRQVGIKIEIL